MNIKEIYNQPIQRLDSIKTILLVGTSEYGFTNEIIRIENEEELIKTFGTKGSIYKSYSTILDSVHDYNISLLVLKPYGQHSYAYFNINTESEVLENALIFKSIYSNEIYNQVNINITLMGIEMTFPPSLQIEKKVYLYKDYINFFDLVDAINNDTYNSENIVIASCSVNSEYDESFYVANESTTLSGGSSGLELTHNEKYEALNLSYSLIRGLDIDYVTHTDIHYNDFIYESNGAESSKNFYKQLLDLCIDQLSFGILTLGILSFDTDRYDTKEVAFEEISRLDYKYKMNEGYEKLKFLITIIYDYLQYDYKKFKCNPTLTLALELAKYQTLTNIIDKPLKESISLNNYLLADDLQFLNEKGINAFRDSAYYDSIVFTNGVTNYTYKTNTEYKYLTSINMLQSVLPKVKAIFEKYLGESIYMLSEKKYINDEINSMLSSQSKVGNVDKYNFTIKYDIENHTINYELELKNIYMLDSIKYIGKAY